MKNSLVAFSIASVLVTSLTVFVFKTGIVAALTATSTSATSTDAGSAIDLSESASSPPTPAASSTAAEALTTSTTATSTSAAPVTDGATSTASALSATSSVVQTQGHGQVPRVTAKPALKRVHVVGSKYVDFFTDGTTIFSFPGDPAIDANLNKADAAIPTHAGLTWVSSKAMEAYDTPSGDLEAGAYAQEADGSFITNVTDFSASATSTIPVAFSLLDPTLDTSAPPPAPKTTEASVPLAPAYAAVADRSAASTTSPLPNSAATASSTPDGSTTASASSTAAAAMASSTPVVVSATSTATSTAASSSVASSSFASANDNAASTTATQ